MATTTTTTTKKQQRGGGAHTLELAKARHQEERYVDNYERKAQLLQELPGNNPYGMRLTTAEELAQKQQQPQQQPQPSASARGVVMLADDDDDKPAVPSSGGSGGGGGSVKASSSSSSTRKTRKELSLSDIVVTQKPPAQLDSLDKIQAVVQTISGGAAGDATEQQKNGSARISPEDAAKLGAVRIHVPADKPLASLLPFVRENLPVLALARRKADEELEKAKKAQEEAASKAAATPTQPQRGTVVVDEDDDDAPITSSTRTTAAAAAAAAASASAAASSSSSSSSKTAGEAAAQQQQVLIAERSNKLKRDRKTSASSRSKKSKADDADAQEAAMTTTTSGEALIPRVPNAPADGSAFDPAHSTYRLLDLHSALLSPYYHAGFQYGLKKCQFNPEDLPPLPDPHEDTPEHVRWCMTRAYKPFPECSLGALCQGMSPTLRRDGPRFPLKIYVSPAVRKHAEARGELPAQDENGRAILDICLRCYTNTFLSVMFQNLGSDKRDQKVACEFYHKVSTAGGYDPRVTVSFSDGHVNGLTRHIRRFEDNQFYPCETQVVQWEFRINGTSERVLRTVPGYAEHEFCFYHPPANLTPADPSLSAPRPLLPPSPFPPLPASLPKAAAQSPDVFPVGEPQYHGIRNQEPTPEVTLQARFGSTKQYIPVPAINLMTSAVPKNGQPRSPLTSNQPKKESAETNTTTPRYTLFNDAVPTLESIHLPTDLNDLKNLVTFLDLEQAYELTRHYPKEISETLLSHDAVDMEKRLLTHLVLFRVGHCQALEAKLDAELQACDRKTALSRKQKPSSDFGNDTVTERIAGGVTTEANRLLARRTELEQTKSQLVYWRELHAPLVADLLERQRSSDGSDDTEDPPHWFRSTLDKNAHQQQQKQRQQPGVPYFELVFLQRRERSQFPLYDKDLDHYRRVTQMYSYPLPTEVLKHAVPSSSSSSAPAAVLVSFRQTIEYFSTHGPDQVTVPTKHWTPHNDDGGGDDDKKTTHEYFSQGVFEDMKKWITRTTDRILAKDSREAARRRVASLQTEFECRRQIVLQEILQNAAASSSSAPAARSLLRTWTPAPLGGRNAASNYLILNALVYRINHGLEQLEHVRKSITQLETSPNYKRIPSRGSTLVLQATSPVPEPPPSSSLHEEKEPIFDKDDSTVREAFRQRVAQLIARAKAEASVITPAQRQQHEQLEQLLELLHCWKRYVHAHLPLAQFIVDAPQCDDAYLLAAEDGRHLSPYTRFYPYEELSWTEEHLMNLSRILRLVDVVYGLDVSPAASSAAAVAEATAAVTTTGGSKKKKKRARAATEAANVRAAVALFNYETPTNTATGAAAASSSSSSATTLLGRTSKIANSKTTAAVGSENCWSILIAKLLPKACAEREFASVCDQLCRMHAMLFDYVCDAFFASLLGLYRHCRNPPRFSLVLSLFRLRQLARREHAYREAVLAVLFSNEELVIEALRENICWQFANDANLWMIDVSWVHGCMYLVRTLFDIRGNLTGINQILTSVYSSHSLLSGSCMLPEAMALANNESINEAAAMIQSAATNTRSKEAASASMLSLVLSFGAQNRPSVYRVDNRNLIKYLAGLFHEINMDTITVSLARHIHYLRNSSSSSSSGSGTEKELPKQLYVFRLSDDAFKMVVHLVQATRPGGAIQVDWFRHIGISADGIKKLVAAYTLFCKRAHENDIKTLLRSLSPLDYELADVFFRYMLLHSSQSLVPLDKSMAFEQAQALRRRYNVPADKPLPPQLSRFFHCSITACNEMKNYVVQHQGFTRFYGITWAAYDADLGYHVCVSKKTVGDRSRNRDRMQNTTDHGLPWLRNLRNGALEGFYGSFCPVEDTDTRGRDDQERLSNRSSVQDHDAVAASSSSSSSSSAAAAISPTLTAKLYAYSEALANIAGITNRFEPDLLFSTSRVRQLAAASAVAASRPPPQLSNAQLNQLEMLRDTLEQECNQEAERLKHSKYQQPCYRTRLAQYPACGYVLEKYTPDEKPHKILMPLTTCPKCGSFTLFSLSLFGPNGFTCGHCDWVDRELFAAPRCFCCNRHYLERFYTTAGTQNLQYTCIMHRVRLVDDRDGWVVRTLLVCNNCHQKWFNDTTLRSMTLLDVLNYIHSNTCNRREMYAIKDSPTQDIFLDEMLYESNAAQRYEPDDPRYAEYISQQKRQASRQTECTLTRLENILDTSPTSKTTWPSKEFWKAFRKVEKFIVKNNGHPASQPPNHQQQSLAVYAASRNSSISSIATKMCKLKRARTASAAENNKTAGAVARRAIHEAAAAEAMANAK